MSAFLKDIKNEIKVRLATYKERKKDLQKAAAEIPILDVLIAEAQAELDSIKIREPDNGN
jgi:hypothetical protein